MSPRHWVIIALVGAVLLGLAAAGVTGLQALAPHQSTARRPTGGPRTFQPPAPTAPQRSLSARQVTIAFAASYGDYLDGAPVRALRFADITARAQARGGGSIPGNFRDGQLHLRDLSLRAGAYSAEATLVLADRQESYPFSLGLLCEQQGWMIASLQPPDLAMDRTIEPVSAPALPKLARVMTRRLVMAYARYRAGRGALPEGLGRAATATIRTHSDSLAGIALGSARPRLLSLIYGPLNASGEFAATATVRFGANRQQFSVLMERSKGRSRWLCVAFL